MDISTPDFKPLEFPTLNSITRPIYNQLEKLKSVGLKLGFPTERDRTTFRDNGTEVSSLSQDKGTTGQTKNLTKGRDGPGQSKFGTGRAGTAKIRDGTWDKTGQSRKGCSKTGK